MANTSLRRGTQDEGNTDYFTGCPIGGGFLWYGLPSKIPSNCRVCDNSTLAISSYAKLSENLGGAWGTSGGNLNIPDLRGKFPRGVDSGIGNDPDAAGRINPNVGGNTGDAVGSVQSDANLAHEHFTVVNSTTVGAALSSVNYLKRQSGDAESGTGFAYSLRGLASEANSGRTSGTGGSESRPKNVNVYFVIRVS